MTRVVAALDSSVAAAPVLVAAQSLAELFGASVEAVHVRENGERIPRAVAARVGVPFRLIEGRRTVAALRESAARESVVALVVGARRTPAGARPVGTTALEVMRGLAKPVVVVPPDTARPGRLRRFLVPLEGTRSTSLAPKSLIHLAQEADLEVVVVHVRDESTLPAFTDQPQHEVTAWAEEFLARYCPWGVGEVRFEFRIGRSEEQILLAAQECAADVVALGWSQELASGRAPVVRAVLERAHVPILLIPVRLVGPLATARERRVPQESLGALR